jgi:hypothetical protein
MVEIGGKLIGEDRPKAKKARTLKTVSKWQVAVAN